MKDMQRVLNKYQSRVASAAPDYAAGVQTPKADWLDAYTKAQPRMVAAIQDAIAKGKMVKGAQANGGSQNWKDKAASKGARNYAASAQDAANGYAQKLQKVLDAGEAARKAAAALPNTTFEQRLQRSIAAQKAIHDFHAKG